MQSGPTNQKFKNGKFLTKQAEIWYVGPLATGKFGNDLTIFSPSSLTNQRNAYGEMFNCHNSMNKTNDAPWLV